jgi:hypothetical protein
MHKENLLEWQRLNRMKEWDFYGQGATGIMGGMPGQYQFSSIPNPTPLQNCFRYWLYTWWYYRSTATGNKYNFKGITK